MNRVRILTLLVSLMVFVMGMQAKTSLVCVGISDYPGVKNDLRVSANDALTIQNIFTKNGNTQATSLVNSRATKLNICNEMKVAFSNATASDIIILYFSGHGIPGGLCCYDGQLYYKTIFEIMRKSRVANKVILVDACYAGKMRTTNQKKENYSDENVMLFLSSRSKEPSQETPYKNSLFTIYLERGLRGGADIDLNKDITARELYNFVHHGVSQTSGGTQHPVMWGNFDNDMTIIKW